MGRNPNPARPEVLQNWEVAFGRPPPQFLSVPFMQKALDHEAQCKRAGGLPAKTRRTLDQIAGGRPASAMPLRALRPGAQYVREWNGRTYQVTVVHDGFEMDGQTWPSLSAIAKHITGTTWSGPRFFGVTTTLGKAG